MCFAALQRQQPVDAAHVRGRQRQSRMLGVQPKSASNSSDRSWLPLTTMVCRRLAAPLAVGDRLLHGSHRRFAQILLHAQSGRAEANSLSFT